MKFKILITAILIISISKISFSQTGSIKGTVKTSDGFPAELVNVGLKGTGKGTTANSKGEFEIANVDSGTYTLIVSLIGLETKEQPVKVKAGETTTVAEITLKENAQQLKDVVITGYKSLNEKPVAIGKVAMKPMDVPQSISSIDKEVLEQQQTLHISDAVKNFNGVYVMGSTGGYQEELAGRGFPYGSSNTFKNGVRFNNSAMPEMSSLERVESLKGSSAILFGNVAAGGIINLVTKKPMFERGGEVTMRCGSYYFFKPTVDIYGSVNDAKTVAYRLSTSYEKGKSFRDEVESERFYINPSLLVKLGKKTDLLIEGDYMNDDRTADFGVGAINYELIDIPRSRFIGVDWSYIKTEQQGTTGTLTHRFNDKWEIRNVTSYQRFDNDLFANQRPNGNSQFIKDNGDWIRGLQRTRINEEYYLTQFDLTGKFSTGSIKHIFLFGADMDNYQTKTTAYNPVAKYDTINVFDPEKFKERNDIPDLTQRTITKSPVKRSGVYVQDLVELTKKIKLLAGIRFSYLETFSDVYTYSTDAHVETKMYDHAFTPRVGLVYQPIKSMAFFGSYANSFTPNTGVDINGAPLPPSFIDQYEVGMKNDLFNGMFSVNITAYQIVNSALAQTSLENGNTNSNIKELAGEVTSKGIELDIMSKEWKGLSVIAGYSYNDTRYTKSNTFIVGSKLRYNPENTANTSVYYSFKNCSSKCLSNFNASAGVLYIGDRQAGRSTRLTVLNDAFKLIPLPAYVNLEAGVGYVTKSFSLRVRMTNITNALSYNAHDDNSVNPIAPRMVSATVGVKF